MIPKRKNSRQNNEYQLGIGGGGMGYGGGVESVSQVPEKKSVRRRGGFDC